MNVTAEKISIGNETYIGFNNSGEFYITKYPFGGSNSITLGREATFRLMGFIASKLGDYQTLAAAQLANLPTEIDRLGNANKALVLQVSEKDATVGQLESFNANQFNQIIELKKQIDELQKFKDNYELVKINQQVEKDEKDEIAKWLAEDEQSF